MADEEAAFLASMKAANDAAGNFEAAGGASDHPAESNSDEYDPFQAVPILQSSATTQSSPVDQSLSTVPPSNEILPSLSAVPLTSNLASNPQDQSATDGQDLQSRSRSMSRASSSEVSSVGLKPKAEVETAVQAPPYISPLQSSNLDAGTSMQRPKESSLDNVEVNEDNVATPLDQVDGGESHILTDKTVETVVNGAKRVPGADIALAQGDAPAPPVKSPAEKISLSDQLITTTTNAPKARLPHDTIGILEDRIKDDPRGDKEAWLDLISEHRKRGKLDEARKAYERFFEVFPSAAEQWLAYAKMENDSSNTHDMEKIFQRTLLQIPYLPLWSLYLDHIRRINNLTTDASGNARQTIYQAYDLALQQIGLDKDSGSLWQDYVQFIKSGPGNIGGSGWQDQQKMDLLRKVYQRAICVPTQSTNVLWKEYDGFERGLNKITGQKFLQDQSPAYMSARSSYTALQNLTQGLRRTTMPALPPIHGANGDVEYIEQLEIWKRWIQWEKEDPLVLQQEDVAAYRARIIFVYKQALMAMRFWPELWCDASEFCFANQMESEGNDFLVQGLEANPESCLLAFKRADHLESGSANEEGEESAKRRGAAVREVYDRLLDALYDLLNKSKVREEQDLARVEAAFAPDAQRQPNGTQKEDDDDEDRIGEQDSEKEKVKQSQITSVKISYAAQKKLLSRTISHVWIALMRAMRRIQGKASFRAVFGEARKRGRLTSEVYIAVALIEFHCYEPDTGRKIFDRGLKLFQEDETFALAYIKHLVASNDHINARVAFETTVDKLVKKPDMIPKAKPLYAYFHDFESRYGELSQILKLEKRMRDLFPEDPALRLFSHRFVEQGFDPTAVRPILSPSQSQPKLIPSIETTYHQGDVQQTQNGNPPKRPLPVEDGDNDLGRPKKTLRGESPLKGAAGRRLDQQKRSQMPVEPPSFTPHPHPLPPPPLPRDIVFLLSIIPKAETYQATKFKPAELVRLIRETNVPTNISQLPQHAGQRGPLGPPGPSMAPHISTPVHHASPTPVQQRPPMPPMPPVQYGQYGNPFNGPFHYNR